MRAISELGVLRLPQRSQGVKFSSFDKSSRNKQKSSFKRTICAKNEAKIASNGGESCVASSSGFLGHSDPRKWQPVRVSKKNGARRTSCAAYISPPPSVDSSTSENEDELKSDNEGSDSGISGGSTLSGSIKVEPVISAGLIARLLWEQKLKVLVAVACLVAGTFCTLSMPQYSGRFFETLIGKREGPLTNLLASLAIVYFLEPVCTVLYVSSLVSAWEGVMENLKTRVFARLLAQKVEFFDKHKVGELTSLLATELTSVEKLVTDNVSRDRGFRSLSEVVGTIVILYSLSAELAPLFAIFIIGISAGVAIYKRITAPLFKLHAITQAKLIESAAETFGAIRTVRSFGGELRQLALFSGQAALSRESGTKLGSLKSANEAWTRVSVYVSLLAVYFFGGSKVKAGLLPVGTMVAFIGYTFTLTFAIQGLVNTLSDLRSVQASLQRVISITSAIPSEASARLEGSVGLGVKQEEEEREAKSQAGTRHVCQLAWEGDLILEKVHFAYPQRPDHIVLHGINLWLPRGSITALVGSSGAGKSTVVQLLSRFYQPTSGNITLAGQDIKNFKKSDWSRAVALVNQEPVLFAMSVRDNIAYGLPNEEVTDEQVEEAAKAANAHDFILSLPQGYDTMVGERGSLLSGGQRQRIAIARAILKDSPILILDEATSALDSVSERLVQQALERLMQGRTTLVIAHRLSTVQSANQIAVIAKGEVIELGSHAQLVSKGGAYADLVNSQRLSFE